MKYLFILFFLLIVVALNVKAQQIDSLFFNLYTDSLKKGVQHYNYINVDGKRKDGSYTPLDTTQIILAADAGVWKGNSLIIDSCFQQGFVTVTAILKINPLIRETIRIYIKRTNTDLPLKTEEEVLNEWNRKKKKAN